MKKLTALSLALLLALFPAAAGALAMEQLHPPAQTEPPALSQEEPKEEPPPVQTEQPEEENPPVQTEEKKPPIQAEEELPQPPVWTEVSTVDALCAAGGKTGHIRLTADLTVSDPDLQFYTFWTPTTLDMNGHHIQIEEGGWLSFGGGSTPVVILGHGGEEGAFRVLSGGRLDLGDVDASQFTGLLARQAEGGCLVTGKVTAQPEQIAYAQAPVLLERFIPFAAIPSGLSQEELAAQLPDVGVYINYQGRYQMFNIPAGQLSWDIEGSWESISAGRRTVLHAWPAGPITGEDWFESELIPTVLAPLACELAILVDGAAIGEIIDHHTTYGSSYELYFLFPDRVQPESLPLSEERGPICLEFSLDGGESWLSVTADEKALSTDSFSALMRDGRNKRPWEPWAQLFFYQMNVTFSVRAWADYQGEGYTFRLYTDTLALSPKGAHVDPGSGGSRGGTVDLLPTPPDPPVTEPDPPEPVRPPVEDTDPPEPVMPVEEPDPPEPVTPPVEETDPPEPVTPPVEETDPPEPVTPPVEDTDPSEPVTPPVEDTDPSEPVTSPEPGEEYGVQPEEPPEEPGKPADPAPRPAQTTPPDSQTQHTAVTPSPEKQPASALSSPTVQVLAAVKWSSMLSTSSRSSSTIKIRSSLFSPAIFASKSPLAFLFD